MILTSRLLASIPGIKHGFSTRLGGISTGTRATLDLGESCTENLLRFRAMVGVPSDTRIAQANQVHGTHVLDAATAPQGAGGDALVSFEPDILAGVRTADCVPILVAAVSEGRPVAVAAIHAGWRGACAGILQAALERLPRDAQLTIALGPSIEIDAFEVGEEVIEAARSSLDGATPPMIRAANGKAHLDLRGLLEAQLRRLDVPADRIERTGGCTFSIPALYFSYRRDNGAPGRHLSAIGFTRATR